jgi:ABC-type sugar transport system permease subunit
MINKNNVFKRKRESWTVWLFVIPGVLLAVVFKIFPLFRGLYDSLFHFKGGWDPTFVGLENFQRMIGDPAVRTAFLNAIKVMVTLPVWIIVPLILAFLIFQRTPGWSFFRAVFFLPYIISPIIVGQIFREVLGSEGPVNSLLKLMKLDSVALVWLGDPRTVLWTVVFVALWSFNGLGVITYLAGFATISEDLFDAAAIDGASFWGKFFHITLPIMRPIIGYWTVLCTGGMLLWMFPFIFALTQGGPGYSSMMPEYLVYMVSFKFFERGYGTAIGVVLFIIVLIFTFFQVRYMYGIGNVRRNKG